MSFPINLKSTQDLISELAYLYISAGNKKAAGWSSLRQQYLSFPEFHKGIHNWYFCGWRRELHPTAGGQLCKAFLRVEL